MKLLKINGSPHAVINTEADLLYWQTQTPLWTARGYDITIINLIPCPCGCLHVRGDSRGWVEEDYESIKKSMAAIADMLGESTPFCGFNTARFRKIPRGDDVVSALDYANKLLARMYDFADANSILLREGYDA